MLERRKWGVCHFYKIGCHGNVLWDIEKEVHIYHLHPKRFHLVNILRKSVQWILR